MYDLTIGGIWFHISAQQELTIEESLHAFLKRDTQKHMVSVYFSWDYASAPIPNTRMLGEDLLQEFYQQDGMCICMTKGGWKGYIAAAVYDKSYADITCYINAAPFAAPPTSLGTLLRMLPMRAVLQHYGVLFFHAAQIVTGDVGVLFTAPSGTGKTTQAKLWQQHRNARIICSDRTLVGGGVTYGYPMDGSEPVCSGERNKLGAVIILAQSGENRVCRLRPAMALAKLLPQMVIDGWNADAVALVTSQLLELIANYPVYQLECTPDQRAVRCLEEQLNMDGVI